MLSSTKAWISTGARTGTDTGANSAVMFGGTGAWMGAETPVPTEASFHALVNTSALGRDVGDAARQVWRPVRKLTPAGEAACTLARPEQHDPLPYTHTHTHTHTMSPFNTWQSRAAQGGAVHC